MAFKSICFSLFSTKYSKQHSKIKINSNGWLSRDFKQNYPEGSDSSIGYARPRQRFSSTQENS